MAKREDINKVLSLALDRLSLDRHVNLIIQEPKHAKRFASLDMKLFL